MLSGLLVSKHERHGKIKLNDTDHLHTQPSFKQLFYIFERLMIFHFHLPVLNIMLTRIHRLRASSKKGPISNSFSTHLVEKFQRYRELGLPIRVHLRMDARSESGADFFTC